MRMTHLLAFAAPLALLLPLSAQAAWPKDLKAQYTAQCVPAAAKTIGEEAAKAHCACGADKIEKNFTTHCLGAVRQCRQPSSLALAGRR